MQLQARPHKHKFVDIKQRRNRSNSSCIILHTLMLCNFYILSLTTLPDLWSTLFEPQSDLNLATGLLPRTTLAELLFSFLNFVSGLKLDLQGWDTFQYVWRQIWIFRVTRAFWLEEAHVRDQRLCAKAELLLHLNSLRYIHWCVYVCIYVNLCIGNNFPETVCINYAFLKGWSSVGLKSKTFSCKLGF